VVPVTSVVQEQRLLNKHCCCIYSQILFHWLHVLHLFTVDAMKRVEEIKVKRQNQFIINRFVSALVISVTSVQKLNCLLFSTPHTICIKITFTAWPLPCNYCISALCLHGQTWPASDWHVWQSSSGNAPSRLCQSERRLLWTQSVLNNFD